MSRDLYPAVDVSGMTDQVSIAASTERPCENALVWSLTESVADSGTMIDLFFLRQRVERRMVSTHGGLKCYLVPWICK